MPHKMQACTHANYSSRTSALRSSGPHCFTAKFVNAKNECFHMTVFLPLSVRASAQAAALSTLPVLFCLHGAGMSGDNFTRLARELCRDDSASAESSSNSRATARGGVGPVHEEPCASSEVNSVTEAMRAHPNGLPYASGRESGRIMSSGSSTTVPQRPQRPLLPPARASAATCATPFPATAVMARTGAVPRTALASSLASSRAGSLAFPGRASSSSDTESGSSLVGHATHSSNNNNADGSSKSGGYTSTTSCDIDNNSMSTDVSSSDSNAAVLPFPAPPVEPVDMIVVAYDMRCHGQSTFAGGESSLTIKVLTEDFGEVLMYTQTTLLPRCSALYILGHSLGGSVMCRGLSEHKEWQSRVRGVVLLDVVEDTAKMSLHLMPDFLEKRPRSFQTVAEAQRWFVRCGGMRSIEGAAVSVPPLLRQESTDSRDEQQQRRSEVEHQVSCHKDGKDASALETVADGGSLHANVRYVWRTNLHAMSTVWDEWFDGLDAAFVSLPCPKILCLAHMERIDTALITAQMQGKFQAEIMGNNCGHYVMDDAPHVLAEKLHRFIKRIEGLSRTLQAKVSAHG